MLYEKSKKGAELLNPNLFERRIVQTTELFDFEDENGFDNQTDFEFCIDSHLDEININTSHHSPKKKKTHCMKP